MSVAQPFGHEEKDDEVERGRGKVGWGSGANRLPWALTRRTGFLLSLLGQLSRDATEQALEPLRIKPHHYGLLVVLAEGGPAPQQAVRESLSIEKSSMVVFVDHLERLRLVERHRNPENRRACKLTLTAAGRELLSEAEPLIEKVEEAVLAPLDDAQRRHLHQLLLSLLPHSGERTHG